MMEIMAPAFYPLVQLATVIVPQTLEELPSFLISLSTMKRIHVAYCNHCTRLEADKKAQVGKWKKYSLTEEDLADILIPTKSKKNVVEYPFSTSVSMPLHIQLPIDSYVSPFDLTHKTLGLDKDNSNAFNSGDL